MSRFHKLSRDKPWVSRKGPKHAKAKAHSLFDLLLSQAVDNKSSLLVVFMAIFRIAQQDPEDSAGNEREDIPVNLRRVALGVVILLFVSLLAFGPELVSAKRGKDDARSAKSRIAVHSDRNASEERDADKRRDRRLAKKSSNDKPNAFGKVVRFVKNLVTKSESEAEQAGEDEEENDDDLPPFLRGKIDRQEYLTARQEWVNMKLGMTPGLTYDPIDPQPRH